MNNMVTFEKLHNDRRKFLVSYSGTDHIVIKGQNNVLISAPHGVSQVRLGKHKVAEIGSITTALYLKNNSNCYLIAKTTNNNDDANFDDDSKYKDSIRNLIKTKNIKYIIDFHGLRATRSCDINLGIHLGKNIENNVPLFDKLNNVLTSNNISVEIDQPFMAGSRTISGSMKNEFDNIWTIQIELNCGISNRKENFKKYQSILDILLNWIQNIED